MPTIADLCDFLDEFAPPALAAEWDNVGLLVGDRTQRVQRAMTCLTVTPAVAAEAVRERAELVVTHHPLPFKPLKRLTTEDPAARLLLELIRAGVAIHSPHTAFDSAAAGINQQLAEGLGLSDIQPLEVCRVRETHLESQEGAFHAPYVGAGRFGSFPGAVTLGEIAARLWQFLGISGLQMVGDAQRSITRAAVACGSGGEFLEAAISHRCELLVTGETRLHTCYEADARGVALLLPGHYASERFGVERLAEVLAKRFPEVSIWASRDETDPLQWI